jgi:hypothetical protein
MSFPASPTNGQSININGKQYVYSSADRSWTVVTLTAGINTGVNYVSVNQVGAIASPMIGTNRYYPPVGLTVTNVYASLGTPSNTTFTFIIKKNGVDTGYNFSFTAGSYTMTPVSVNITVNATDYLTMDITAGTGSDLRVEMKYQ